MFIKGINVYAKRYSVVPLVYDTEFLIAISRLSDRFMCSWSIVLSNTKCFLFEVKVLAASVLIMLLIFSLTHWLYLLFLPFLLYLVFLDIHIIVYSMFVLYIVFTTMLLLFGSYYVVCQYV